MLFSVARAAIVIVIVVVGVTGCSDAPSSYPLSPIGELEAVGYTYHHGDGNRLARGSVDLLSANPIDIPLDGRPIWLAGVPRDGGTAWVAILEDGRAVAYQVDDRGVIPLAVEPATTDPTLPPIVALETTGTVRLAHVYSDGAAPTGFVARPQGRRARIAANGDLLVETAETQARLAVHAMPNARLLSDMQGRLLFLARPSDRYAHDVLAGYSVAESIVLVETEPELRIVRQIDIPAPQVVEGNALIWADLDGDEAREIMTTVADPVLGAYLVAYDEAGSVVAKSAPIGQTSRWRHQLAVAEFSPGRREAVAVLTPHIDGVVEFYRRSGATLEIVAGNLGLTSHRNGSRNIDMGIAGDFDGDEYAEMVIPAEDFLKLGIVRRTSAGIEVAGMVDLGGYLTTNLAAVTDAHGALWLGAGHEAHGLRVWR